MSANTRYASIQRDDLVERHALLVKRIAYHMVSRMPPSVEVEDLMQAGMIGLMEAARNFVASKGVNFATFAGSRIRGAMLDEVRKFDWTPRSVHRKFRQLTDAMNKIQSCTGRVARDAEVAAKMGISLEEYHRVLQDASGCRLFSFEQLGGQDSALETVADKEMVGVVDQVQEETVRHALAGAIEELPGRERLVMSLYYDDELTLREIGEVLEVSESRVCQIRCRALARLRARMERWRNDD